MAQCSALGSFSLLFTPWGVLVCFTFVESDLLLLQFKYPDSGQSNTLCVAHSSALSEDKGAFGRTASSLNTRAWGMVAGKG